MKKPSPIPIFAFVFDRYHKASTTKMAVVELRIAFGKKQKYISSGVKLYSNEWHNGNVVNRSDALLLTQLLEQMLADARQTVVDMVKEGCAIDIFDIPRRMAAMKTSKYSFIEFVAEQVERHKHGKKTATQKRYDYFVKFLIRWGKIERFSEVNEKNIIVLDNDLKEQGLEETSQWANYHRFMNTFIRDAIREGYLKRNPYDYVTVSRKRYSDKERFLTPEEFYKIRDVELPTPTLRRERDLFVLQAYLCTSHADLFAFSQHPHKYIKEVKGEKVFTGKRIKTGREFACPIIPQAIALLDKYDYKLPVLEDTQKRNGPLKLVAQAAGLDYPLSTHWARHTGGTLFLNAGVNIAAVAKMLGDTVEMTERVYAKYLDTTVVDAIQKIENIDNL